jgi:tetratricopeptide (TPR) repeat protein
VTGVDEAERQTLALLSALLDQSLLQCSAPDGGEPRFTMLETTRAYALECLAAGGELEMLRRRHARYFLQCAEIAHRQENTGTQPYWLRWILSEHANLSAALAWSIEADPSMGLALVAALYGLWFTSGQFAAAQMWLARALTQRAKAPSQLQAQVLLGAGLLAMPQGAFAHMEAACAEALALFRATDDQRGCAEALLYLSIAAHGCGDSEQARALTHQGLELARRTADLSLIAIGELFLADRASWIGECEQAERHYQASLAISRQLGDPWVIGLNQLGFGRIARTRGQYQQAQRILEEALAILRSVPAPMWIAQTLHELGQLGQQTGDIRRAIAYQQESLALTYETGGMVDVPACLERLAAALVDLPDLERAICLLGAAAALRASFDPPQAVGDAQIYVDVQAAARDHLGEQVAADAWDMGRALAIDAAIALALAPIPG